MQQRKPEKVLLYEKQEQQDQSEKYMYNTLWLSYETYIEDEILVLALLEWRPEEAGITLAPVVPAPLALTRLPPAIIQEV